eukprot:1251279-Amphidinium_carterae.1
MHPSGSMASGQRYHNTNVQYQVNSERQSPATKPKELAAKLRNSVLKREKLRLVAMDMHTIA